MQPTLECLTCRKSLFHVALEYLTFRKSLLQATLECWTYRKSLFQVALECLTCRKQRPRKTKTKKKMAKVIINVPGAEVLQPSGLSTGPSTAPNWLPPLVQLLAPPLASTTGYHHWPNHSPVSYTHLRAHETREDLVCRLLLEKKKLQ